MPTTNPKILALAQGLWREATKGYGVTTRWEQLDADVRAYWCGRADQAMHPSRTPGLAPSHLVGRIAAIAAGSDHAAWLAMSDEQRVEYYRRAEKILALLGMNQ